MIEYLKNTLLSIGVFVIGIALGLLLFYLVYLIIRLITKNKKLKKIRELNDPLIIINASIDEFKNNYAYKKAKLRFIGVKDIIEDMTLSISKCYNSYVTSLKNSFHDVTIKEIVNTGIKINDLIYNLVIELLHSKTFKVAYSLYRGKEKISSFFGRLFKKQEEVTLDKDFSSLSINQILDLFDDILSMANSLKKMGFVKEKETDDSKIPLFDKLINDKIIELINSVGIELIRLFSHDESYEVVYA